MVTAKTKWGRENAFKSIELLLHGIAVCTGIDVVLVMKKQRRELTSLEVELAARQSDNYPKLFHTIEVRYIASGRNLYEKRLARAIELFKSRYCVVSQTIGRRTKVVSSYEIRLSESGR